MDEKGRWAGRNLGKDAVRHDIWRILELEGAAVVAPPAQGRPWCCRPVSATRDARRVPDSVFLAREGAKDAKGPRRRASERASTLSFFFAPSRLRAFA